MANYKYHILLCGGTGCRASKSEQIAQNFKEVIKNKGLENDVQVVVTGCFGFCEKGPIVKCYLTILSTHKLVLKIAKKSFKNTL